MTRFARAKGSKASNERIPEEATSWTVMKQQLLEKNKDIEESKKRMEAMDQRNANYKAFLLEKEKIESKESEWSNFPGVDNGESKVDHSKAGKMNQICVDEEDDTFQVLKTKEDKVLDTNTKKLESDSDDPPEEDSAKNEIDVPIVKVKKPKKKKIKIEIENGTTRKVEICNDLLNTTEREKEQTSKHGENHLKRKNTERSSAAKKMKKLDKNSVKQKKNGIKEKKVIKENPTPQDLKKIEKKKQKRIRQLEKKKRLKAEKKEEGTQNTNHEKNEEKISKTAGNEIGNTSNTEMKKLVRDKSTNPPLDVPHKIDKKKLNKKDNKEQPRKKPLLPHKMFINGQELEIDYVDGFPVKKEDALRLKKLRREMISKGLPRSEINQSLKLERRKAEKAFAREKKKVCFNCRTSGHNLSECPELGKNQIVQTAGSGICFKCGSTEHTHFECKVVRGQEFKFAQCFICQEQGHIARQCPDNARGLYPKGGACNVCGDVTHLKRDCPKYQAQQQHLENNLRVETVGLSNPDVLEIENKDIQLTSSKKCNKIIKF